MHRARLPGGGAVRGAGPRRAPPQLFPRRRGRTARHAVRRRRADLPARARRSTTGPAAARAAGVHAAAAGEADRPGPRAAATATSTWPPSSAGSPRRCRCSCRRSARPGSPAATSASPLSRQAGRLGIPMVIGENVVPMHGYGAARRRRTVAARPDPRRTPSAVPDGVGGVVVQQSTEDADAEVWNLVYSDPVATPLLDIRPARVRAEGRPGRQARPRRHDGAGRRRRPRGCADQYAVDDVLGPDAGGAALQQPRARSPRRSCASRSG